MTDKLECDYVMIQVIVSRALNLHLPFLVIFLSAEKGQGREVHIFYGKDDVRAYLKRHAAHLTSEAVTRIRKALSASSPLPDIGDEKPVCLTGKTAIILSCYQALYIKALHEKAAAKPEEGKPSGGEWN